MKKQLSSAPSRLRGEKRGYVGRVQVRFGDVDRAGIVYYPRIFDYFHQVFEGYFDDRVGISYHDTIEKLKVGFPAVRYEVDFLSPLAYGDRLPVRLTAARIGRSSVTFRYEILRGKKRLVDAFGTAACVDMRTFRPIPIPARLRKAFGRILLPAGVNRPKSRTSRTAPAARG